MEVKPYEWMVKFSPQKEWIMNQGLLLWLAFFFIELGAGTYFVSLFLNSLWGMVIGFIITTLIGGGLHLLYLGRPSRFWRILWSTGWRNSWVSRGLIFIVIFIGVGISHLALYKFSGPDAAFPLGIVMYVISFLCIIYGGFAMSYVNAIPLWNTPLLPVLYVVSGLWGGAGLAMGVALGTSDSVMMAIVETWVRILLISFLFLVIVYLWTMTYGMPAGKQSVSVILRAPLAPLFYVGVLWIGIFVPLMVVIYAFAVGIETVPSYLLVMAILFELVGDLCIRYCILKGGLYAPLIPSS
ncbi:MAG: NrfD/PsrC family molybdoenzyme membrane anchor subunit [Thermodesulfobacteriota bacterium]|nr:NrfD/PsrC family molybdoenzyme membrane anchor subunit [Thermodesulfobacteriota bacterium]